MKQQLEPLIIPRDQHSVSRKDISPNVLKTLQHLNRNGFIAYIVGGGIRDLLLGHKPKDLDLVTSATPNQVKKLFRNCRLIGRRFRLAHLHFRDEIIELATFRCAPEDVEPEAVATAGAPGFHRAGFRADAARRARPGGAAPPDGRRRPRVRRVPARRHDPLRRGHDPARQPLGHPRPGRLAPRLHPQRPVLQPAGFLAHRLRRRPGGHPRRARPVHRRPGPALRRGPGADDPGGALRRQARLHHRAGDLRRDPGAPRRHQQGLLRPDVRGDLQAVPARLGPAHLPAAAGDRPVRAGLPRGRRAHGRRGPRLAARPLAGRLRLDRRARPRGPGGRRRR